MKNNRAIRFSSVKFLALVSLISAGAGCSTTGRIPAASSGGERGEVLAILQDLRADVSRDGVVTRESCEQRFRDAYGHFISVQSDAHKGEIDLDAAKRDALQIAAESFQLRLELHRWLERVEADGTPASRPCISALRDVMRASRFLQEYLLEWKYGAIPHEKKKSPALFSDLPGHLDRAPGHEDFKGIESLRSGDVIISRGGAISSASIARMPDHAGQFSHLSLVYVDPQTRKAWTIEAKLQTGTSVRPFETGHQGDRNPRELVLRFKGDPALAHEAARVMFERARAATATGTNIPYDFHMNLADESELFCSEIVSAGYRAASSGAVLLPQHMSNLAPHARPLLDALEIPQGDTFAPSDMELDSRFEVVAEWRDLGRIRDTRLKDATLDSFYDWIETKNYDFSESFKGDLITNTVYKLRHWPAFADRVKKIANRLPLNMKKQALAAFTALDLAGGAALKQIEESEAKFRKKQKRPMTLQEIYDELERIRVADSKKFRSKIHKYFAPKK